MEEKNTLIVENGSINNLAIKIEGLIQEARQHIVSSVNTTMVYTYYEIGRYIVEDEQNGQNRAEYGKSVLKKLSAYLTPKFGKGFSVDNLQNMRNFYLCYSNYETLSRNSAFMLSWSHYLKLMRISNPEERRFYEIEAIENNNQIFAAQYETILPSKEQLKQLILEK